VSSIFAHEPTVSFVPTSTTHHICVSLAATDAELRAFLSRSGVPLRVHVLRGRGEGYAVFSDAAVALRAALVLSDTALGSAIVTVEAKALSELPTFMQVDFRIVLSNSPGKPSAEHSPRHSSPATPVSEPVAAPSDALPLRSPVTPHAPDLIRRHSMPRRLGEKPRGSPISQAAAASRR
jgi:hypothetical protein